MLFMDPCTVNLSRAFIKSTSSIINFSQLFFTRSLIFQNIYSFEG